MSRSRRSALLATGLLWILPGCTMPSWLSRLGNPDETEKPDPATTEALKRYAESAAVKGTIGEVTWIQGMRKMSVRGYGLVVGLGENGSRSCPAHVRSKVAADLRKTYRLGDSREGLNELTPEKLMASRDTAVVLVLGEINAAALRGEHFDVVVQAIPGTDTLSLENGRLLACDLRLYRDVGGGNVQEGKILARAEGPVFVKPFAHREDAATPANLQVGRVLGGGVNLENRRVTLVLLSPSYAKAIRIKDRINDRFGEGEHIASADSPGYVSLHIPKRYAGRELDFLALVRHLYMDTDAAAANRQALALADEMLDPQAPHDSIGLALEGLGKSVKPIVRNLYTHQLDHVRFFSARTGLRLEDEMAVPVLRAFAVAADHPLQYEAVEAFGQASTLRSSASVLEEIAAGNFDPRVRVAAYEGLLQQHSSGVISQSLGDGCVLDHVRADEGRPIIYAKLENECRLAIIGDPYCRLPLFYRHPGGLLTMNADPRDGGISLVRGTPSGQMSPTITAPLDALGLVGLLGRSARQSEGKVVGLGLSYAQLIEVLYALCEDGSLAADFRMELPGGKAPPTGRQRWVGRPGSEL